MKLHWHLFERQDLPSALRDLSNQSTEWPHSALPNYSFDLAIGGLNIGDTHQPTIPSILLVGSNRNEVFSWISTFADEKFPVGQFCRVITMEDWTDLEIESVGSPLPTTIGSIWPSLVLGEMIGQLGGDTELSSVPLSRASACLSFSVARTELIYSKKTALMKKCFERLSKAENDAKFSRKNITTESLIPIWNTVLTYEPLGLAQTDFFERLFDALACFGTDDLQIIKNNKFLMSDSAEDRVKGFDSLVNNMLSNQSVSLGHRTLRSLSIAAAALVAGRGTSHLRLLSPFAKDFPEVYVWYGLFAGVVGSHYWDKAWTQQSKGVERSLRQFFRIDEPVQADLCWSEYDWLADTYESMEIITGLPRSSPNGLTVEILPGVICQFRLKENKLSVRQNVEKSIDGDRFNQPSLLSTDEISKALNMLSHVQQLLWNAIPNQQTSLFPENESSKNSKPKKSRGTSNGKPPIR